jgi:hypothetical protein
MGYCLVETQRFRLNRADSTRRIEDRSRFWWYGFLLLSIWLMAATKGSVVSLRVQSFTDAGDASITNRILCWVDVIPMVLERPFGWRWGGWFSEFSQIYLRSGQTSGRSIYLNDFLSLGLVFGPIAALGWLWALGRLLSRVMQRDTGGIRPLLLFCFLPTAVLNTMMFDPLLAVIWWWLVCSTAMSSSAEPTLSTAGGKSQQ